LSPKIFYFFNGSKIEIGRFVADAGVTTAADPCSGVISGPQQYAESNGRMPTGPIERFGAGDCGSVPDVECAHRQARVMPSQECSRVKWLIHVFFTVRRKLFRD
jgi:hypothetical protein